MSLALKLYRLGQCIDKDNILNAMKTTDSEDKDYNFLSIDFTYRNGTVRKISINTESVSMNDIMLTYKIGGSGSGMYYLYPNLNIQKFDKSISKNIAQLENTVKNSIIAYCNNKNKSITEAIIKAFETDEYKSICEQVDKIAKEMKENIIFSFTVNRNTFYNLMSEIIDNWIKTPEFPKRTISGQDSFTGEEAEVGYSPDFKVFSYDQYDNTLNHRLTENLMLSKESARNMRFAWVYIMNNLLFNFRGLEYVIIPNVLNDDNETLKTVIHDLSEERKQSKKRKDALQEMYEKEKRINKKLERLKNKRKKLAKDKSEEVDAKKELENISGELFRKDRGIINEFNKNASSLKKYRNSVTLDFIFTKINLTNKSFEIKGTIEDVLPSRLNNIKSKMDEFNINDKTTFKREKNEINLNHFFNRRTLYHKANRSKGSQNIVIQESITLARFLITDEQIKTDDLLRKFHEHREYNFDGSLKINDKGIKRWIEFPSEYTYQEARLLNFLNSLNKIKEK